MSKLDQLITLATRHGRSDGLPTPYPRLTIRSTYAPTSSAPALFEPKFYLLLQGAKRMTIAGGTYDCGPGTCAVASVGLPFVSQVVEATSTQPYLSLELNLDTGIVAALLLDIGEETRLGSADRAISLAQVDDSIIAPLERLVRLLDVPSELSVLASQFERELCFRLLMGPFGARLRQIGVHQSRFGQIKMATEWISANADKPMSVKWLASYVQMSLTSFHRHFKAVTAYSPLAYQRHIRLLAARRLLTSGTVNVTETAFATGYVSASQFSREYKRAFGVPPLRDASLLQR